MAVFVVIEKSAAGVPALQASGGARGDAGFFSDIGERAVAVVAIERAIAPISDEKIDVAVVVVVARANALGPNPCAPSLLLAVTSVNVPSRLFL